MTNTATVPSAFRPAMGTWTPGFRFILSVYPEARSAWRIYKGRHEFTIPAAPRQGFAALKVYDTFTVIPKWTIDGREDGPAPLLAATIAQSLVEEWAANRIGMAHGTPGIGVLEPVDGQPYPEEIDTNVPIDEQPPMVRDLLNRLLATQTGYFRGLYQEGEQLDAAHKPVREDNRLALNWLGLDAPWNRIQKQVAKKECIVCASEIPAKLLKCNSCGTDLPAYYLSYGIEPKDDGAVAAFIARMPEAKRRQLAGEPEPPKPEPKPVVTPQFPKK